MCAPWCVFVCWAPRHGDGPFVFPSAPLRSGQMVRPRGFCLLLSPPQGRALCLPFGSASLRTNGPSPRLLFAAEPATGTGPSSSLRLRFASDNGSVPKASDPWPLAPDPCYFFQEPVVAMASGTVPA